MNIFLVTLYYFSYIQSSLARSHGSPSYSTAPLLPKSFSFNYTVCYVYITACDSATICNAARSFRGTIERSKKNEHAHFSLCRTVLRTQVYITADLPNPNRIANLTYAHIGLSLQNEVRCINFMAAKRLLGETAKEFHCSLRNA
jgi:hypothetical protein